MENFIDLLNNHTSVRKFKDEPLDQNIKQQLLAAAHHGSSSNFVQATSIIEITDVKKRSELAEISKSASYVNHSGAFYVFVADLYRQSTILKQQNKSVDSIQNMEALMVSIVDTAIAGENMAVAAESLDLGICFIGGIRNDIYRVAEILDLPKYTVPLFGMTIGIPELQNEVKPRMLNKNSVFENAYNTQLAGDLSEYKQITNKYYKNRSSRQQDTDWVIKMKSFLEHPRREDVSKFIKDQGFKI